jgi:hypothetical protein
MSTRLLRLRTGKSIEQMDNVRQRISNWFRGKRFRPEPTCCALSHGYEGCNAGASDERTSTSKRGEHWNSYIPFRNRMVGMAVDTRLDPGIRGTFIANIECRRRLAKRSIKEAGYCVPSLLGV